eukprot:jgi/Tetstr1/429513/TSEL_019418.t1
MLPEGGAQSPGQAGDGGGPAELSADERGLVAEQLGADDGGSWRRVLRSVCRVSREGVNSVGGSYRMDSRAL